MILMGAFQIMVYCNSMILFVGHKMLQNNAGELKWKTILKKEGVMAGSYLFPFILAFSKFM